MVIPRWMMSWTAPWESRATRSARWPGAMSPMWSPTSNTLMGVVSFHDVARAVLDMQGFENKMLKAYIRDWPEEEKKN